MRKIQIERKLFELFGFKFFVFENFQDSDLDIDDKSIYPFDNENQLVELFATNQFFTIWNDEKRFNAGLICACEGQLDLIMDFLKKIGVKESAYSTFDCGLQKKPNVLYLKTKKVMTLFSENLLSAVMERRVTLHRPFFSSRDNIIYP